MANQLPPVLFLIFSRPSTTERVFEQIRKAKPSRLFIAADGPRKNKPGEFEKCQAARAIVSKVDWECEVKTLFRDENLGCGRAVSGAIDWFFEHVEEGIILEDDTNPSPDFFRFCSEMLDYYRDDIRVMEIGGSSMPNRLSKNSKYSYFFSDWDYIWGWATWKRAWKHYDYSMKLYPEVTAHGYLLRNYTSVYERYYMEYLLSRSHYQSDSVTFWDIQWGFARKINSGLVVVPTKNMVVNLGFGLDATNTTNAKEYTFMKHEKMEFPLRHPEFVMQDRVTDKEVFIRYSTSFFSRLRGRLKSVTPAWFYDIFKNMARKSFSFFLLNESVAGIMSFLL
jgi:hypothetical protein